MNWIIFWIESAEFSLNWIIFWIESWEKQYLIKYWQYFWQNSNVELNQIAYRTPLLWRQYFFLAGTKLCKAWSLRGLNCFPSQFSLQLWDYIPGKKSDENLCSQKLKMFIKKLYSPLKNAEGKSKLCCIVESQRSSVL